MPSTPRPTVGTFFTTSRGVTAVINLRNYNVESLWYLSITRVGSRVFGSFSHSTLRPYALTEGFPPQWTLNTATAPVTKGGVLMKPKYIYRTLIIGHMLTKLYGAIMEAELNNYMETLSLWASKDTNFRRAFSTTYHIFMLRYLNDHAKACKKKIDIVILWTSAKPLTQFLESGCLIGLKAWRYHMTLFGPYVFYVRKSLVRTMFGRPIQLLY